MLEDIILFYINTKVYDSKVMALENIVSMTDENNYDKIVTTISQNQNASELDLSLYIKEIASESFIDLKSMVKRLLSYYHDEKAIQVLKSSLVSSNLNKPL